VRVLHNDTELVTWTDVATNRTAGNPVTLDVASPVTVAAGDWLHFQINKATNDLCDSVYWNPSIAYMTIRRIGDADNDGLADWVEDRNGNGVREADETDWQDPDTDYDGVSDAEELAGGADPLDVRSVLPKRLSYWKFNGNDWARGDRGQKPLVQRGTSASASWEGTALALDGAGSLFRIRQTELDSRANFNLLSGAVRMFFKPDWSLTNAPAWGQLLEVGTPGGARWGVHFTNVGGIMHIRLVTHDADGSWSTYTSDVRLSHDCTGIGDPDFAGSLGLPSWHELTINYWQDRCPTNSLPWLALDGTAVFSHHNACHHTNASEYYHEYGGHDLPAAGIPSGTVRLGGLAIGGGTDGTRLAGAMIDEVEFFNHPIGRAETNRTDLLLSASVVRTPSPQVQINRGVDLRPDGGNPPQPATLEPALIFRRIAGASNWTCLTGTNGTTNAVWIDTDLATNTIYIYGLTPSTDPPQLVPFRRITVGIDLAPVHQRGQVILIVESNLVSAQAGNISTELALLRTNLVGDGWRVTEPLLAPRHDDVGGRTNYLALNKAGRDYVTNLIYSHFDAAMTNVIFIVGHVTIPYSGGEAWDNHDGGSDVGCHGGPWVADGFYGCLAKTGWSDTGYVPGCEYKQPGDGCFDHEGFTFNLPIDAAVGRVDFARLPAFTNAVWLPGYPTNSAEDVEVALLRQYIYKDHLYRHGRIPFGKRVCYAAGLGYAPEVLVRLAGPLFGQSEQTLFSGTVYDQKVPCAFGVSADYGRPTEQKKYGDTWFGTSDLADAGNEPAVVFHTSYGSWFCDWNWSDNNLLRALLAGRCYGLGCLPWYKGWAFDRLGVGGTLGDCMRFWAETGEEGGTLLPCQSVLGDPTLRISPPEPVAVLSASKLTGEVRLQWAPPSDGADLYFVYRSTNGLSGFAWPMASVAAGATGWNDSEAAPFPRSYMVRAGRLVETGAGSYHDLSQGVVVDIQ
jgi:hypothetical protein